jgi:hypothetical protein
MKTRTLYRVTIHAPPGSVIAEAGFVRIRSARLFMRDFQHDARADRFVLQRNGRVIIDQKRETPNNVAVGVEYRPSEQDFANAL